MASTASTLTTTANEYVAEEAISAARILAVSEALET